MTAYTAGTVLGGRYRFRDLLARGGMGEVWRAVDERLGREIAVKVLHTAYAGDEAFHQRFRAEARNTAAFSHPGVAQVYDFGDSDGSPWIVMELVPGEPLSSMLERGPLGVARTLDVLAQTARALQAAHAAGVVHRDVKPGNLLVTPDGVVKVTDFGIARAADALPLTATGTVMGSAPYLSPEQAHGRSATAASDVYALGVVAYECLVGHRPFVGDTAVDVAAAHASEPPPPLPAAVPQPLKDLVFAMLAKDPALRPDDRQVAERAEALRGASGALATGAPAVVPEGGWREPVPTRTQAIPPLSTPLGASSSQAASSGTTQGWRIAGDDVVPGFGAVGATAGASTGGLRPFTPPPRRRGRVALAVLAVLVVAAGGAVGLGILLTGGLHSSGTSGSAARSSTTAGSANGTASTSSSPSSAPSASPSRSASPTTSGGVLDPQTLVGQQDRAAFAALQAAGYHYNRLRKTEDGAHDACSVASVRSTGAKSVSVTVWWPTNGDSACAPLGGSTATTTSTTTSTAEASQARGLGTADGTSGSTGMSVGGPAKGAL